MYTFSAAIKSLVLFLLTTEMALAENLLSNSTFDAGIDGWWTSVGAEWESSFGFERGSLHLYSPSADSQATQCVEVPPGNTYVATARVYSHCVGDRLFVVLASKADCSDAGLFEVYAAHSSLVDSWELLTISAPVTDATQFAEISLYSDHACANGAYFDDVTLQNEHVFANGFERDVTE
jgi:hypothetical protein